MGSTVVATVLAIETKTPDSLEVAMSLGNQRYTFLFGMERDPIEPQFISLLEDREFSRLFKFNAPIVGQVFRLISRVHNGEKVQFPVKVGEFYTREEALQQLEKRHGNPIFPTKSSSSTLNRRHRRHRRRLSAKSLSPYRQLPRSDVDAMETSKLSGIFVLHPTAGKPSPGHDLTRVLIFDPASRP